MILKFDECKECKKRTNDIYNCIRICDKPFEALEKFNRYKKLEKQGRLLKLPCAVGDTVYIVKGGEVLRNYVVQIHIAQVEAQTFFSCYDDCFGIEQIGKTVFLTREEAEAALKKWRVNNGMVKKTDRRKS